MENGKGFPPLDGLKSNVPLGGKIGHIKVGVRPVDPLLMERLTDRLADLQEQGVKLPDPAEMAVRSIDGFYHFPSMLSIARGEQENVVSVVNYDPVRRTFLLSKDGEPRDIMELFWFGFETFPGDMILVHMPPVDGNDLRSPENLDRRVELSLAIMRDWKGSRILRHPTGTYWRGENLDSLIMFIKEYQSNGERDQMSQ
ncbi:MAG: hypothetical protein ACMUHB_05840 [Thermoplasmatota archaeon]